MGGRDSASMTACTNYSSVRDHVQTVLHGATQKYHVGAYLHWYWKHGCDKVTWHLTLIINIFLFFVSQVQIVFPQPFVQCISDIKQNLFK